MGDQEKSGISVLRGAAGRQLVRGARSGSFSAVKRRRFAEAMAAKCDVRLASAVAGMSPDTIYQARIDDPIFAAQWDAILASGYDRLEAEALRYALGRMSVALDPLAEREEDGNETAGGAVAIAPIAASAARRASDADLRFVLTMLGRHARSAKGGAAVRVALPSEADTDARLTALLDKLERQMAR